MFCPWHNDISETHIRSSFIALQAALLNQFIAEPTESKSVLVVAETRSGYNGKPYVGKARSVAVTVLETKIHHVADDQGRQVLVVVVCWGYDLGQDVQSVEDVRVGHHGQVHELLDLPTPKQGPDSVIFTQYLIPGRMRRPVRAAVAQVFKADLHAAVAPGQSGEKREAQPGDDSDMVAAFGTLRQQREPIFGRHHTCGQSFALGHKRFDRENELVVLVPALFS